MTALAEGGRAIIRHLAANLNGQEVAIVSAPRPYGARSRVCYRVRLTDGACMDIEAARLEPVEAVQICPTCGQEINHGVQS